MPIQIILTFYAESAEQAAENLGSAEQPDDLWSLGDITAPQLPQLRSLLPY